MEHKYPSIDNHYKSVGDMLGDPCVAWEKIDGCNFSVHIYKYRGNWKHDFYSRNQKANKATGSLFGEACELLERRLPELIKISENKYNGRDMVFYFEIFGSGVQKRVDYTLYIEQEHTPVINGRTVALIDVKVIKDDNHVTWLGSPKIRKLGKQLGVYVPTMIFIDRLTLAHIEDMVEVKGIEGYVLRGEDNGKRLFNQFGDLLAVKVKTNEFSAYEKQGPKNKKARPKTPPAIIEFLLERINYGRLHSIYSHGHDTLKEEMSDMRYLPDLIVEDIKGEDSSLWDEFDADVIRKTCARMLPKVLKGFLLEKNVS